MQMPDRGSAYRSYLDALRPAADRAQLWRLVLGAMAIGVIMFGLTSAAQMILAALSPSLSLMAYNGSPGSTPLSLLVILGSFGFLTIACFLTVRLIHNRSGLTLLGPRPGTRRQFGRVLWALFVLGVVMWLLPPYGGNEELTQNLPFGTWLKLLPFGALALLIQTSAEEVLFRGYLQQQLAARFSHPLIWIGVPSVLFGLGHYTPAEAGSNAIYIALWATLFGALMADLTARADTLGPAMAVHLMNNLFAVVLVSLPDSLSGLALYTTPYSMDDERALAAWLPVDLMAMLVSWLAARLALRR